MLRGHDAAIDFSASDAVITNVTSCVRAGVPIVEGTTGWNNQESEVRQIVAENGGALIYGANFSIGVNLFYGIVVRAGAVSTSAELRCVHRRQYHSRKRDAPSGTALRLRDLLASAGHDLPSPVRGLGRSPVRIGWALIQFPIRSRLHTRHGRARFCRRCPARCLLDPGTQRHLNSQTMIGEILKAIDDDPPEMVSRKGAKVAKTQREVDTGTLRLCLLASLRENSC